VLYTNQKKKNGGKILHVNQTTVSEMLWELLIFEVIEWELRPHYVRNKSSTEITGTLNAV
jgi:hypothetical protein